MKNMDWTSLLEQIKEYLEEIGYVDGVVDLLAKRNWMENPPFDSEKFNYGKSRFTLFELCEVVEMLTGNNANFAEELRKQILRLVPEGDEIAA